MSVAEDRWARINPKNPQVHGPPCQRCGSDSSERYRMQTGEVKCVNDRGCILRRHRAGEPTVTAPVVPLFPPNAETFDVRLFLLIVRLRATEGRAPTWAEMCAETGLGRHATWHHLDALRRVGLVTWERGKDGTLRPTAALRRVGP